MEAILKSVKSLNSQQHKKSQPHKTLRQTTLRRTTLTTLRQAILCGLTCLVPALGSVAVAQDININLNTYTQLQEQLDAVKTSISHDRLATVKHFDAARNTYKQLRPSLQDARNAQLLNDAINRARAAQSRTPAEVKAQIDFARGLMRKALYDQTLSKWTNNPNSVKTDGARIQLLGREFALEDVHINALAKEAKSGQFTRAAWRLQRSAIVKTRAYLKRTPPQRTEDAYLNLIKATSWFSSLQADGQRLQPPLMMSQFEKASQQLSAGQIPALKKSLKELDVGTNRLLKVFAKAPSKASNVNLADHQPAPTVLQNTALFSGGVIGAYAALAKAYAAADHGNPEQAREELAQVQPALEGANSPLTRDQGYATFLRNLKATQQRKGVRPADISSLIAGLDQLERSVTGGSPSIADRVSALSGSFFSGIWRAVLFLLLGLFALWPLRLMRIAFGAHRAWNTLFWSLILFMMPLFLEGFFGTLSFLGDMLNLGFMRPLSNFTLTQGSYGLLLQFVMTAAAIGLATYSFYQLCTQFGLIGTPQKQASPPPSDIDWDEEAS